MRSAVLAVAMSIFCLAAASAQAPAPATLRQSELSKHSFEIGQMNLTVQKFRRSGFSPYIVVKVENSSDSPILFDPQVLSFVGKGNQQVDTGSSAQGFIASPSRKVLPGAFIIETYLLDHPVELVARLYYDGRLLAVITE